MNPLTHKSGFGDHEHEAEYDAAELRDTYAREAYEALQLREKPTLYMHRRPFKLGKSPLLNPDVTGDLLGKPTVLGSALDSVPSGLAERLDKALNEAAFRAGGDPVPAPEPEPAPWENPNGSQDPEATS